MKRWIPYALTLLFGISSTLGPTDALAHDVSFSLGGKKIQISSGKSPAKQKFLFKSSKEVLFNPVDPIENGASLVVRGVGPDPGKTDLITLDPQAWKGLGKPAGIKGYKYQDKTGARGGVTKIIYKSGVLSVLAKGENWTWVPDAPQDEVWVHFRIGQPGAPEFEWLCTKFGGTVQANDLGSYKAKLAEVLVACPEAFCGNGEHELGEECDDGNSANDDGCNADCTIGECVGEEYDSTYDAIQTVIFDNPAYTCTSAFCHGAGASNGGLALDEGVSHANLVGVDSQNSALPRVTPGDKDLSFLYEKLAARTLGTPLVGGQPMPAGATSALTEDHLEAMRLWIQAGASETDSVAGTEALLGGCLPDPTPLTIPAPNKPAPLAGVQVQSTPWDLPGESENEVCFATYYDFTGLVPESAQFECENYCADGLLTVCDTNADCGGAACLQGSVNNPGNKCFRFHKQAIHQDPQSHHAFVRIYLGVSDTTDPRWGDWTRKYRDQEKPEQGSMCDPLDVDPAVGVNPNCSSEPTPGVACIGFGPTDLSQGSAGDGLTGSGTTPTFTGAGVPVFEQEFPDGVYSVLPMQGIFVWNSHAFNLTNFDSTMNIYLNLDFAAPEDQLYPIQPIFEDEKIFIQNVPPYETREYCWTWTAPQGARIDMLTSHTHQWGVRWRTWAPPNNACEPPDPNSCATPRFDTPLYLSGNYSDPLNLYLNPLMELDSPAVEDRTFLFCSLYDNGSTPESPSVKRRSTAVGTANCPISSLACYGGVNRGVPCAGDDSVCDSFPGAGDGVCDACPVRGGITTTDEMFILQGDYYVVPLGP